MVLPEQWAEFAIDYWACSVVSLWVVIPYIVTGNSLMVVAFPNGWVVISYIILVVARQVP